MAPPAPAPAASPSPVVADSPRIAHGASPESKALAEANSRIAVVESERDALAAEVARLERQEKSSPAQQLKPPLPAAAASPAPLPAAGVDLGAATASLPQGMSGRLLIRYPGNSAEARRLAGRLVDALNRQGVEVADVRESAAAIRTELRFSYAPDEAVAQQVGRLVGITPVRRLQAKDGLLVRPGTLELDLSGESHLAAIKTTSSRESEHE